MRRSSLLHAAIFVLVSVGTFFLPVYPCLVEQQAGETYHYILPLPPFLVISNGFYWKETTAGGDWGSTWTYSANPFFLLVLVLFIVGFGIWLWTLDSRAKTKPGSNIERRRARITAICQATAFFNLAGSFIFTSYLIDALYIKGLKEGLGRYIIGPQGAIGERYELSNPPVYPSLYIPYALCVIAVLFGIFYAWLAYKGGPAAGKGGKIGRS
jgi:hypothetical protein